MTEKENLNTCVLLCESLESLDPGLDLMELCRWLEERIPGVHAQVVPDLGRGPRQIVEAVTGCGGSRLVLGLSSGAYELVAVQQQARKAGLDPLGVEAINLGTHAATTFPRDTATQRARILLAAAVASTRAYSGSRPENSKPFLPSKLSRRSLLSLSLLEYRSVPSIHGQRCTAVSGCRICVQACPCGALRVAGGRVVLQKTECESCGLCVVACPREVFCFPGHSQAQLVAQITTLLDPNVGTIQPRGILFACRRREGYLDKLATDARSILDAESDSSNSEVHLLPVVVPCLGMVPPTWLLECLTMGARVIKLLPCLAGCPFGQKEVVDGGVAFCEEILEVLDESPERIGFVRRWDGRIDHSIVERGLFRASGASESVTLGDAPARTILRLAERYGASDGFVVAHPQSPLGLVEVKDTCTTCGVCATACPVNALVLESTDGGHCLAFDAALCMACGQCIPVCPEQAILLEHVTDTQRLAQGKVIVHQDRDMLCKGCGAPIASETMLRQVAARLAGDSPAAAQVVTRYCPDCRVRFGSQWLSESREQVHESH